MINLTYNPNDYNENFYQIIDLLKNKSIAFYDSEFIRNKIGDREVFEIIQVGITAQVPNNDLSLNVKHNVKIPPREQILLSINKDGYSQTGDKFELVYSKITDWIEQNNIDYIVAFSFGEDIEILKKECNNYNLSYHSCFNNFIDIFKLFKSYYNIHDVSLKNLCYLYDIELDPRFIKKSHEALSDAINTKLFCEYFINNISNTKYSQDYIRGFIFAYFKFDSYTKKNLKTIKQKELYSLSHPKSLNLNRNNLFNNLNKDIMQFILIKSIPDNQINNSSFITGFNYALKKLFLE